MKKNLTYVPKEKKVNYFIVVLLLLLVIGISVYTHKLYNQQPPDESMFYRMCDFNAEETQKILKEQQKIYTKQQTILFEDYGLYGETLSLYHQEYALDKTDLFAGDTIFLNNLCQTSVEDKSPFLMANNLDVGIEIWQLEDGLYELEVLADFDFKRLKSDTPIDETFNSVKRDGIIKSVRLFTDKKIINQSLDTEVIKDNYIFLEVKSIEEDDAVDVYLNPAGFTLFENGEIDFGHFQDDFYEADEMFKLAYKVKDLLQEKGIRAEVLRDDLNPTNNFGKDGRLKTAYEKQAKYMVNMRFETSGSSYDYGISILYSNFTSNRFASIMAKKLLQETPLRASYYDNANNPEGVFQTLFEDGYDYNDIIRESGGKFTGASKLDYFHDMASFSEKSRRGINTIDVLYGYMSDEIDLNTWVDDFNVIAQKTAEAILIELGMMGDGI